jgi:hypothetical protein
MANTAERSARNVDAESCRKLPKSPRDNDLRNFIHMIESGLVVSTTIPVSINAGNFPETRPERSATYRLAPADPPD